ncbi:MAG: hypothetical protein HYU43_00830 [Armatimonadetes bacterium]|nr:hypothetical protein [Planctomycetota bacterium]MBI2200471.1 hypothetical protein [Armatimonadota bacterium]
MTDAWTFYTVFLGGVSTLAIYSFLYRENPFYRAFEHLYIGIATGLGMVTLLERWLWPKLLKPVLNVGAETYATPPQLVAQGADLTSAMPYNRWLLLYLVPVIFGLGYYTITSARYNWIARVVISFTLGYGGGLAFKGFFAEFIPQVVSSFKPLVVPNSLADSLNHVVFTATLVCVMTYFFFSFEHDKPGIRQASTSGRWLLMISFGAFFGATIMARMSLLIERLQFFIEQWFPNFQRLAGP